MKESFRSTQPITEFALNVLYRLQPPAEDPDHRELVARDLIDTEIRNGRQWWRVRFNHVNGPPPDFRRFAEREEELRSLYQRVEDWICREGVRPGDIRVILNDKYLRKKIAQELGEVLGRHGVRVEDQTRQKLTSADELVIVTTAHSYKGHEGEVVAVPAADKFVAKDVDKVGDKKKATLPATLYVALTRARSLLYVSSIHRAAGSPSNLVLESLQTSIEDLRSPPTEAALCTPLEENLELLERVEPEHRDWLKKLLSVHAPETGPVLRADGSILAEPLFRFRVGVGQYAFFVAPLSGFVVEELEDARVKVLRAGQPYG